MQLEDVSLTLIPSGILDGEERLVRGHLPKVLTEAYLRRVQYRGSDIRMDLGLLFDPEAYPRHPINAQKWQWQTLKAWPWRNPEHINVLEARAILQSIRWRARAHRGFHSRYVHLSDSQVCLAIFAKGRSSSFRLNQVLRKACAVLLSSNSYPLMGYVKTDNNPADAASRKYDKSHQH